MLAFRLTLKVKPGCMDKAVEVAQSVKFAPEWKGRIYASGMGSYCPGDILIFEEVYESVAEREAYWEKNLTIQNLLLGGMNGTKLLRVEVPWKSGI